VAFISDRSGREEIYVAAADGSGEARKLTDRDVLKYSHAWSPDSKEIVFTTSDNRLLKCSVETGQVTELATARYSGISAPAWSPDGVGSPMRGQTRRATMTSTWCRRAAGRNVG